ncbi:MAG: hypothetical protein AAF701_08590, partial [Pseudomonadota bacterium]
MFNAPTRIQIARLGRWMVWVCIGLPMAICMALLICGVLFVMALQNRSIPVPDRYVAQFNAQISDDVNGYDIAFDRMEVGLNHVLSPQITLLGATIAPHGGQSVFRLSALDLTVDGIDLAQGDFQITDIAFTGGVLRLQRDSTGAFNLGLNGQNDQIQARNTEDVFAAIAAVLNHPNLSRLARVDIDGMTVAYEDALTNTALTFDGGRFFASRHRATGTLQIRVDLALLTGRGDPATLAFSLEQSATGAGRISAELDDILSRDIAQQFPQLNALTLIDAPVSGSVQTRFDPQGIAPINATLDFSQGTIFPDDPDQRFGFSTAKTYFTYDPTVQRLDINTLNLVSDWGQFDGQGYALVQ